MKIPSLGILLSAALLTPGFAATVVVDDFSTDTTVNYTTASGRSAFTYSGAGVGVGGVAGRLNVPSGAADVNAAWTNETSGGSFGADTTFVVSTYFLTGSLGTGTSGVTLTSVGLGTADTSLFNTTSAAGTLHVDVRRAINGTSTQYGFRFRSDDANTVNGATTIALASSNWYQVVYTATRTSANNFSVAAELRNWGSDGVTGGGSILSGGTTYINNNIGDGDAIFGGFLGRTTAGTGTPDLAAIDNFSLVPEPAALSLLGLGGVLALRRRR